MSSPRTTPCPGCGATYAAAPPVCLVCGFGAVAPAVHPQAPAPTPRKTRRRPRPMRIVSLVSMLAGLGSTALGLSHVLGSGSRAAAAPARQLASANPKPSPATQAPAAPKAKPVRPPPSLSVASPTPTSTASTCSNDVFGYSLRYKGPWTTANATSEQACAFFDTSPLAQSDLLAASRAGHPARAAIQITAYGGASTYDQAVIDIHNRPDMDAGDTIDLGVGNTFGERIMARVRTAGGTHTRMFMYLFDLRGKPFVATAYEPYSANFDQTVNALDRMMRTLHVT